MKIRCQNCQFDFEQNENHKFKFCPNCGSNMKNPKTSKIQIVGIQQPPSDSCIRWIKRIFSFKGRARRLEYWTIDLSMLFLFFIVPSLIMIINSDSFEPIDVYIFGLIYSLLSIPVSVRRLHDIGKSGWWLIVLFFISLLVSLIPYIGDYMAMGVFLYFYLQDSKPGDNIYGPNPKGLSAERK